MECPELTTQGARLAGSEAYFKMSLQICKGRLRHSEFDIQNLMDDGKPEVPWPWTPEERVEYHALSQQVMQLTGIISDSVRNLPMASLSSVGLGYFWF